jgi:hypothetical protein
MSDTNFKFVGKNGKNMTTLNTQFTLLKCLTDDMLNPLIRKFESNQIIQDIYNRRKDNKDIKNNYDISTNIVMENSHKKPSLYINYYKDNIKVFHLSLHVCPTVKHIKQSILHFKQNTIKHKNNEQNAPKRNAPKRRIKITTNGETNSIKFSLDKADKNTINISPDFLLEANVVIDVLNSYFYKKSPSFIQNKKMKTSKKVRHIKSEMNKSYKNYKKINRDPQY